LSRTHDPRDSTRTNSPGQRPGCLSLAVYFCVGLALAPAVAAEREKPLFELGLAGGGGYLPDYPAAGQNHGHAIALPFFAYRGDVVRSDEKGLLRGRFIRTESVEFDVSLNGSFAVDADDNDARRGMPDLDHLGEVGPRLQITLARAARDARIDLELPVRAVFSTDFSAIDFRGFTFAPQLAYQHDRFFDPTTEFKLGIGPIFATVELMEYFYEVPRSFATARRRAYAADAGYLGTRIEAAAFGRIFPRVQGFFGGRIDFHHGAANESSPLFRERTTYTIGAGLILSLVQSERRVVE